MTEPINPPAFRTISRPKFALGSQDVQRLPRIGFKEIALNVTQGAGEDAVRIQIKGVGRKKTLLSPQEAAPTDAVAEEENKPESGLRALLKQLNSTLDRITELNKDIASGSLSPQQLESAQQELVGLQKGFSETLTGTDVKRIIEVTKVVKSSIEAGAKAETVVKALSGEAGLLGEDFLGLVQSGQLYQIESIASNLETLGGLKLEDAALDPSIIDQARSLVRGSEYSLQGAKLEEKTTRVTPVVDTETTFEAPEVSKLNYGKTGEIGLALNTFIGVDLLKAAQAHYDFDPAKVLTLIIGTKDESDDEKKRRKTLLDPEEPDLSTSVVKTPGFDDSKEDPAPTRRVSIGEPATKTETPAGDP